MSAAAISHRGNASYRVQNALGELGLILIGIVVLLWTLLPIYHMAMLAFTPVSVGLSGQ